MRLTKPPSHWVTLGGPYDCTGHIGPMHHAYKGEDAERDWPMYSFERPSHMVWNTIATVLHKQGWTDDQIKTWLQSKQTRWALDGSLGDALQEAATKWVEANPPTKIK